MDGTEPTSGIRVAYSNRIERLVDALVDQLDRDRGLDGIFEPPCVVVPNRNVEMYLRFELADRFGVVGDVAFSTLETWFRDELPGDVSPLDEERLTSAIVGYLTTESNLEDDPVMEPVRSYLRAGGAEGEALRAHQLAGRLATNFREYGYSRFEMLAQWTESDELYTSSPEYRRNERWQRRIWRHLFASDGALARASEEASYQFFTDYWRHFDAENRAGLPNPVFLFGLSHVAPVFGPIFDRISEVVELRFFVMNPCREYWEDVIYDEEEELGETPSTEPETSFLLPVQDRERRAGRAGEQLSLEPTSFDAEAPIGAPLPLRVWGRAGRDHVHMLNRLSGDHFEEYWEDPACDADSGAPTLLEAFQSDVLRFERAADSALDPEPDGSVRFLRAPGVRRELEAVADAIWQLMREDESLDFNDIAVIVNPRRREEYQMHLEGVFEEVRGIPFNQVDVERGDGSRLLQAIEHLLELPLGEFDRSELGSLLVHPNVIANFEGADAAEWERWCERLAIYHGADAEDHEGTHIDRDLYNWDQGVTRLVLGAFLEGRTDGRGRAKPFELDGEQYLPETPAEMAEPRAAGHWIELVRRLIGEARIVRSREAALGGWLRWMADWIEEHLAAMGHAEEAELTGYLETLRASAEADLSGLAGDGAVPYRAAVEFARSRLASQTYQRGNYLASGVVVSSFLPQRPIPFEAIFMTGLSSEDFPGSSPRTPVDLRTAGWHEGDLWERDRERYMFFETLLSARRRVTCSWVDRDAITGDDLEPSSVVREFQHVLEHYVGEEGLEELVRIHPLRRFDGNYFENNESLGPTYHPSARAEWRAARLRERALRTLGGPETRDLDTRRFVDELRRADVDVARTFGFVDPPPEIREEDVEGEDRRTRELPYRAFRRFLESPLQGWARYRLGLDRDEDESVLEETAEPFELEPLEERMILSEAFEDATLEDFEDDAIAGALRREVERAALEGRAPIGAFGRVAEGKLSTVGEAWVSQLRTVRPATLCRYRFGAPRGEESVVASEAVRIECSRDERVQLFDLTGDTNLVDPDEQVVFVTSRKRRWRLGWRRALRGWVQGLVLSAAEIFEGDSFAVVLLHSEADKEPRRVEFGQNDPDRARAHLERLAAELWFEPHAYRFALSEIETVVDEELYVDPQKLAKCVWSRDESGRPPSGDRYGPVSTVERLEIPDGGSEGLTELLERRMGPFVRGVLDSKL